MKFFNSIQKVSLTLLFSFTLILVNGQNTTRSPYSSFGLGDLETTGYAFNQSLGDTKYGFSDPYQINISNPASYGSLKKPNFNVGITYNFLQVNEGTNTQSGNTGYLKNISLAFPITKWWGSSFGVVPLSKMGYRFTTTEEIDGFGDVDYTYEGEGAMNKVYFGNGFNILNDTTHTLSVGVNASYVFGNLTRTKRVEPIGVEDDLATFYSDQTKLSDVAFDFGVIYKRKITSSLKFSIGLAYVLGDSLRSFSDKYAYNYMQTAFNDIVKDTVLSIKDTGNVYVPQTFGAGFTVQLNRKQDRYNNQYLLAVDYSFTDWSKLSLFGQNIGLAKRDQISVGLQYIPDAKSYKNVQKMINYRAGFRYVNTRLMIDNQNIKEYGISFGVGVPIIAAGQGTMFNLGVEAGRRGNNNVNPVYEQFTNIYLGFSLTPSKFDRWFYKSKID